MSGSLALGDDPVFAGTDSRAPQLKLVDDHAIDILDNKSRSGDPVGSTIIFSRTLRCCASPRGHTPAAGFPFMQAVRRIWISSQFKHAYHSRKLWRDIWRIPVHQRER
jgi:hypothetical protein